MCNPALVVAGLQMGMAAYGSVQESKAQQEQLDYQAAVDRNNAQIAQNNQVMSERQAADAVKRGETDAKNHMLKVAQLKGSQMTAMAANGLALGEGSPLSLLEDTQFMGEYDAGTIRNNASRDAWGYRVGGVNYGNQSGDLMTSAGFSESKSKAINPGFEALTSAAGSVSNSWAGSSGIGANVKSAWKSKSLWSESA